MDYHVIKALYYDDFYSGWVDTTTVPLYGGSASCLTQFITSSDTAGTQMN